MFPCLITLVVFNVPFTATTFHWGPFLLHRWSRHPGPPVLSKVTLYTKEKLKILFLWKVLWQTRFYVSRLIWVPPLFCDTSIGVELSYLSTPSTWSTRKLPLEGLLPLYPVKVSLCPLSGHSTSRISLPEVLLPSHTCFRLRSTTRCTTTGYSTLCVSSSSVFIPGALLKTDDTISRIWIRIWCQKIL